MEKRLDISVVVPLYNEEESLPELTAWIDRVARENGLSYEIVFVDDGSTDGSWETLERLKEHYRALRAIGFARNYGKSAALYCGFAAAEGDVVFTMDADLQDSPDEIPDMRRMILEEGYDMVSGWKLKRHDPIGKRWPSKFFNWTARAASTRDLTAEDGSASLLVRSSSNFTELTSTIMSMRSSMGPEMRLRYRSTAACEQVHRPLGSPYQPQGQGFIAHTSMNWLGNVCEPCTREMVTCPSSSGWRMASTASRRNSGSSSRNSTPLCASEISPGRT